jgi:hypothetical protein
VIQLQPFCVAVGSHFLFPEKPITRMQIVFGSVAVAGAILMLAVQNSISRAARRERAGVVDLESLTVPGEQEPAIEGGDLDAVPAEPPPDR